MHNLTFKKTKNRIYYSFPYLFQILNLPLYKCNYINYNEILRIFFLQKNKDINFSR